AGVQFVERDARAAQALRANLARLKADTGQVAVLDAGLFLQGAAQPYDLVFLDPPFVLDLWSALAQQLEQGGWLASRGWVYVESPRGNAPVLPPNWQLHREGQAGEVRFALYRHALPLS
ncbi:MAG TPA: RsmD family RNA methyltransferase, partial [Rhodanobacter sp.]